MEKPDYFFQDKISDHIFRLSESTTGIYRIIENKRTGVFIRVIKEYKLLKNAINYFEKMANRPHIEKRKLSELPW